MQAVSQALAQSIFLEGFDHIAAAGGLESACLAQQRAEGVWYTRIIAIERAVKAMPGQRTTLLSVIGFMILFWLGRQAGTGIEPMDHILGEGRRRLPHGVIARVGPSRQGVKRVPMKI